MPETRNQDTKRKIVHIIRVFPNHNSVFIFSSFWFTFTITVQSTTNLLFFYSVQFQFCHFLYLNSTYVTWATGIVILFYGVYIGIYTSRKRRSNNHGWIFQKSICLQGRRCKGDEVGGVRMRVVKKERSGKSLTRERAMMKKKQTWECKKERSKGWMRVKFYVQKVSLKFFSLSLFFLLL